LCVGCPYLPARTHFDVCSLVGRLFLVGGRGFSAGTSRQDDPWFVFAVTALLIGPPGGWCCLIGLVTGRTGFRELAVAEMAGRYPLVCVAFPLVNYLPVAPSPAAPT
jgi:hypothetical protein